MQPPGPRSSQKPNNSMMEHDGSETNKLASHCCCFTQPQSIGNTKKKNLSYLLFIDERSEAHNISYYLLVQYL